MAIEPHLLIIDNKLWTFLMLYTRNTGDILDTGHGLTVLVLGEEWSGGLQGLRLPDLVLGEHSELVLLALL